MASTESQDDSLIDLEIDEPEHESIAEMFDQIQEPDFSSSLDLEEPQRDRIVILGRRRAGKTIFISRLYEQLWKGDRHFFMRAITGGTHQACIDVVNQMESGVWPPSTLGTLYQEIEITYQSEKHLMVALDYPGEVFRKAFVEDAETDDAKELLDHVDRAAAVILLLDPAVIKGGNSKEAMDDDFGMARAIRRIREWPGGEDVPVAVVLTKCDLHKHIIREAGGVGPFVRSYYAPLMREVGAARMFASAAVMTCRNENGDRVPDPTRQAVGVVEPLKYCLDEMINREWVRKEQKQAAERYETRIAEMQAEQLSRRRSALTWILIWAGAILLLAGFGFLVFSLVNP